MSPFRLLSIVRAMLSRTSPGPDPLTRAQEDLAAERATVGVLTVTARDQQREIDRLRATLAERDKLQPLTPSEDRAARFVALTPGATVGEIGRAMAVDAKSWMHESRREVTGYDIQGEAKFVFLAFRKGHLRREPDGNTFRYWPLEQAAK
jgi:hypothetical protein